jgi:hypothetical protein
MVTINRSTGELQESERRKLKEQRRFRPPRIAHYASQREDFRQVETLDESRERRARTAAEREKAKMDGSPDDFGTPSPASTCRSSWSSTDVASASPRRPSPRADPPEAVGAIAQIIIRSQTSAIHNSFSVLSQKEMQGLYDAALKFIDRQCGLNRWTTFENLVRCKPREYYAEVTARPDRSLQPYLKDQNGHIASAINGHLEGEWEGF